MVAALFVGVSTTDEALLQTASLKRAAAAAMDLAMDTGSAAPIGVDMLSRDPAGELERLARSIEECL